MATGGKDEDKLLSDEEDDIFSFNTRVTRQSRYPKLSIIDDTPVIFDLTAFDDSELQTKGQTSYESVGKEYINFRKTYATEPLKRPTQLNKSVTQPPPIPPRVPPKPSHEYSNVEIKVSRRDTSGKSAQPIHTRKRQSTLPTVTKYTSENRPITIYSRRNCNDEDVYDSIEDDRKCEEKKPGFFQWIKDKLIKEDAKKDIEKKTKDNKTTTFGKIFAISTLQPIQLRLLQLTGLLSHKNIHIDSSENKILVSNITEIDYKKLKLKIDEKLQTICIEQVMLPKERCVFVSKHKNMQYLNELCRYKDLMVVFEIDLNCASLECYAFSKEATLLGIELVNDAFITKTIPIAKGQTFIGIKTNVFFPDDVIVSTLKGNPRVLKVEGFNGKQIEDAENKVLNFLQQATVLKKVTIELDKWKAKYFKRFLEENVLKSSIENNFVITLKETRNGLTITLNGETSYVEDVERRIKDIHREEIDIAGITVSEEDMNIFTATLKNESGRKYCQSFREENKCTLEFEEEYSNCCSLNRNSNYSSDGDTVRFGDVSVTLYKGELASHSTGYLVNIIGPKKNLTEGVLSRTIADAGGPRLETCFYESLSAMQQGTVIRTPASGTLRCNQVLHVTLAISPQDTRKAIDEAMQAILGCLETDLESIALPPLGVGRMYGYPPTLVAEGMLSALEKYLSFTTIKRVSIVIYHADESTYQDFRDVFKDFSERQKEQSHNPGLEQKKKTTMVIQITAEAKTKCVDAKTKFLEDIGTTFLYKDILSSKSEIYDAVFNIARRHHVFAEKVEGGYRLKGFKDNVETVIEEVTDVIKQTYKTDHSDRENIKHDLLKCSKERVNYMAEEEVCVPEHWCSKPGYSLKHIQDKTDYHCITLDSNCTEYKCIEKMVNRTWKEYLVGHGRDAVGLHMLQFSNLEIVNIERVENVILFYDYAISRQKYFAELMREGITSFASVKDLPGSTTAPLTLRCGGGDQLHSDNGMNQEVNEVYLFHGTDGSNVRPICKKGLDCRLATWTAMAGKGVYATESSTKADQYADPKDERSTDNRKMFLVRMVLGKPHICTDPTPTKYRRPPCASCFKEDCKKHSEFFDSVVTDNGKLFREFIVYDKSQCYPEYLITYNRI